MLPKWKFNHKCIPSLSVKSRGKVKRHIADTPRETPSWTDLLVSHCNLRIFLSPYITSYYYSHYVFP